MLLLTLLALLVLSIGQVTDTTELACNDVIPDCERYGTAACNGAYRAWAHKHCAKYCGFCDDVTATPSAPPPIPTRGTCHDFIKNCDSYGSDVCTHYTTWSRQNCPLFCGYCRAAVPVCQDKIDCGTYASDICTKFVPWSKINCAKTCNLCQTAPTDSSHIQIVTGPLPSALQGCVFKGTMHKQDERWIDNCTWNCTCADASRGYYTCQSLCFQWNLPKSCTLEKPAGKCCAVPKCPDNIIIQYPPGYQSV